MGQATIRVDVFRHVLRINVGGTEVASVDAAEFVKACEQARLEARQKGYSEFEVVPIDEEPQVA